MQEDMQKEIALELGIADLPQKEQQMLIAQFGEVALKSVTVSMLEKLNESKRAAFIELAQAGDAAKLKSFLDAEVPEHEALARKSVAEEVQRFKELQTN